MLSFDIAIDTKVTSTVCFGVMVKRIEECLGLPKGGGGGSPGILVEGVFPLG